MEILIVLLVIFLFVPLLLMLIGFIMLFIDDASRKKGVRLLLIGLIWLVVEVLIGYSICSNMSFH